MTQRRIVILVWMFAIGSQDALASEFSVADVFTDHAVLQQGVALPVWGTAVADAEVTVRFAGQMKSTTVGQDGAWRVDLEPLTADPNGQTMLVRSGGSRKEFRDLLIGEVWYASGQSNMQMKLDACAKKIPSIGGIVDNSEKSEIRFLRIDEPDSSQPLKRRTKTSTWQVDGPQTRGKQSAVAFLFALQLHQTLEVPVGIIEASWGGKPIEGFIPREEFERRDTLLPILSLAEGERFTELASLEGGVIIRNTAGMPARIFNARVAPVAPYAIRGFLWYQGESNAGRGEDPRNYRMKMTALIDGWRSTWGVSDLPFFFVQLPAFQDEATGWARLREEQRRSLEIHGTGMAVTIDLRDRDIHPANKVDVGKRLANWALANTYHEAIPFSGPLFRAANLEGDSMRVEFDHADGGLMVAQKQGLAPPELMQGAELAHFELANERGFWYPARAKIDGKSVLVRSPQVKKPRAVRYACTGGPTNANLYNKAGLPASPFCSDLSLLPWRADQ